VHVFTASSIYLCMPSEICLFVSRCSVHTTGPAGSNVTNGRYIRRHERKMASDGQALISGGRINTDKWPGKAVSIPDFIPLSYLKCHQESFLPSAGVSPSSPKTLLHLQCSPLLSPCTSALRTHLLISGSLFPPYGDWRLQALEQPSL
jgi:hypothetical protein